MQTVLVTNKNDILNISIFDKLHPEIEPLDLKGEAAYHYIKSFYRNRIKNVIGSEYSPDITMEYMNYKLELQDYADIMKNNDYKILLTPIIKDAMEYVGIHENDLPKNKKVTRKNKYAKSIDNKKENKNGIKTKIAVSAITFTILAGIITSRMPSKLDTKTTKEVLENMPDTYSVTNMIEDQEETIAPDITTLEVVNKTTEEPKSVTETTNEETLKHIKSVEHNEDIQDSNCAIIEYSDRSSTEKANTTRENYYEVIDSYCKTYGLDTDLIVALATQERGVHGTTMDEGGATGLMQIQNSVWDNGSLTAYNFDTDSWEQITVDIGSLSDLNYNVKVGCMIFQDCLRNNDYNIIAAIQSYNMGYGTTSSLIEDYCAETGKTREQVLANQNDTGWLNYRDAIPYGDPSYVENVLSYYGESGTISVHKPDGTICSVTVSNSPEYQKSL